ncbi:s-adenosyl-l-methionine-dependent methyltransferase [Lucifera butyrica]|uniref:Demethylmenaquinone methyltransferase n=1 Tax=Lucifera butyrica TaxID=1351585 RepID=A0A498REC4_9FIRM|nr:ubiquinone/menaquinone biosynthesis methyltransferase [Lucifera butyrica]VBB09841.1 s-adenosyl-l-methionine-dependent methyltransferase [Lucifera butyrica]
MKDFSIESKEAYIHQLFSAISCRYDALTSLLSFNRDRYWRQFAVAQTGLKAGGYGLDVCCGTGKLTLEQAGKVGGGGRVVGLDFCAGMLQEAVKNISRTPYEPVIQLLEGNAMQLPFAVHTFDAATIGFALRNVPDIAAVIGEMARVVKPGGRVVSVELAKPELPVFKQLYYLYFERILPYIGKWGTGQEGAYRWLPESLRRYPHQQEVRELFVAAGLRDVTYYELTGGIVAVHVGTVPA